MTDMIIRNVGLVVLILLVGCTSSKPRTTPIKSTVSTARDEVIPGQGEQSVASWDMLFRKINGVQVMGSYPNIRIKIRGATSLNLTTEPLFVLDNMILGNSFQNLSRAITPAEVKSIRVLKGPDAGSYGFRGSNGVIVVRSKNGN